jgi:hypothetical protein
MEEEIEASTPLLLKMSDGRARAYARRNSPLQLWPMCCVMSFLLAAAFSSLAVQASVFVLAAVASCSLAHRTNVRLMRRCWVRVDQHGLEIQNRLTHYRLPRYQIAAVGCGPAWYGPGIEGYQLQVVERIDRYHARNHRQLEALALDHDNASALRSYVGCP